MTDSQSQPVTQGECERCDLRTEVKWLKGWTSSISEKIDKFTIALILGLIVAVGNLVLLLMSQRVDNKAIAEAVIEAMKGVHK